MVKTQFEDKIQPHWSELKRLVMTFIKDHTIADDVLQTSLLKALTSKSQPSTESKIIPWFKAILRNTALDILRKQKRENKRAVNTDLDTLLNEENFDTQACQCVFDLMTRLSHEDQTILRELDIENNTLRKTADSLGITKTAAKVRRHRARQRLKKHLVAVCKIGSQGECEACEC